MSTPFIAKPISEFNDGLSLPGDDPQFQLAETDWLICSDTSDTQTASTGTTKNISPSKLVAKAVDTVAELRQSEGSYAGYVAVRGYYEPEDGGGGMFRWNPGLTDDAVIQFSSGDLSIGWQRIEYAGGIIYPEWGGAFGVVAGKPIEWAELQNLAAVCRARGASLVSLGSGLIYGINQSLDFSGFSVAIEGLIRAAGLTGHAVRVGGSANVRFAMLRVAAVSYLPGATGVLIHATNSARLRIMTLNFGTGLSLQTSGVDPIENNDFEVVSITNSATCFSLRCANQNSGIVNNRFRNCECIWTSGFVTPTPNRVVLMEPLASPTGIRQNIWESPAVFSPFDRLVEVVNDSSNPCQDNIIQNAFLAGMSPTATLMRLQSGDNTSLTVTAADETLRQRTVLQSPAALDDLSYRRADSPNNHYNINGDYQFLPTTNAIFFPHARIWDTVTLTRVDSLTGTPVDGGILWPPSANRMVGGRWRKTRGTSAWLRFPSRLTIGVSPLLVSQTITGNITFTAPGTISSPSHDFISEGLEVGMQLRVSDAHDPNNNGQNFVIQTVTGSTIVLTPASQDVVTDAGDQVAVLRGQRVLADAVMMRRLQLGTGGMTYFGETDWCYIAPEVDEFIVGWTGHANWGSQPFYGFSLQETSGNTIFEAENDVDVSPPSGSQAAPGSFEWVKTSNPTATEAQWRRNGATASTTTALQFSQISFEQFNATALLDTLLAGDQVYLESHDGQRREVYVISGTTLSGGVITIGVSVGAQLSPLPLNDELTVLTIVKATQAPPPQAGETWTKTNDGTVPANGQWSRETVNIALATWLRFSLNSNDRDDAGLSLLSLMSGDVIVANDVPHARQETYTVNGTPTVAGAYVQVPIRDGRVVSTAILAGDPTTFVFVANRLGDPFVRMDDPKFNATLDGVADDGPALLAAMVDTNLRQLPLLIPQWAKVRVGTSIRHTAAIRIFGGGTIIPERNLQFDGNTILEDLTFDQRFSGLSQYMAKFNLNDKITVIKTCTFKNGYHAAAFNTAIHLSGFNRTAIVRDTTIENILCEDFSADVGISGPARAIFIEGGGNVALTGLTVRNIHTVEGGVNGTPIALNGDAIQYLESSASASLVLRLTDSTFENVGNRIVKAQSLASNDCHYDISEITVSSPWDSSAPVNNGMWYLFDIFRGNAAISRVRFTGGACRAMVGCNTNSGDVTVTDCHMQQDGTATIAHAGNTFFTAFAYQFGNNHLRVRGCTASGCQYGVAQDSSVGAGLGSLYVLHNRFVTLGNSVYMRTGGPASQLHVINNLFDQHPTIAAEYSAIKVDQQAAAILASHNVSIGKQAFLTIGAPAASAVVVRSENVVNGVADVPAATQELQELAARVAALELHG